MARIAQESKAVVWAKVEDEKLNRVFRIFYPDVDPAVINLTKQQIAKMVEKQAGKKTPDEIISDHDKRQAKRADALPAEYTQLKFPEDIQDVLNRVGTRVVVSEKYPDTTEGRIKAVVDLKARLYRLKLTLAQAKAMPIKEKITRTPSQRFDVVEFALDDPNAVPDGARQVISAVIGLDKDAKYGKRKGAKAGVLIRLPNLLGKFNIILNLGTEYAVAAEKTDEPTDETKTAKTAKTA